MKKARVVALALAFGSPLSFLAASDRVPYEIVSEYDGQYQDEVQKLKWEIPNIMRQTLIDLSVRLGINFNEDWRYPLLIAFDDGAPRGAENALAYVQFVSTGDTPIQALVINMDAYVRQPFNFEQVLAHELVHAMMNDALGIQASNVLPIWLHEGLAVYGADQGETMVRSYVHRYSGFAEGKILNGLEGPHGALDYAEDYLALKYINETHGSNSFHNFVKDVIKREGDVKAAIEYNCSETWEEFEKHARAFAKKEIERIGPAERGKDEKPY